MRAPAESTNQNDGQLVAQGAFGEPHDLLDCPRAPRPRLHGRIVRHHAHRSSIDRAGAGDDTIGWQIVGQRVGQQPVFDERSRVEQQVQTVTHEELVLLCELLGATSEVALARPLGDHRQLLGVRSRAGVEVAPVGAGLRLVGWRGWRRHR